MRALLLVLCLLAAPVFAHKASDSYLDLAIDADGAIRGRWDIALRDLELLLPLDADADRRLRWGELERAQARIHALALDALVLERGGRPCTLAASGRPLRSRISPLGAGTVTRAVPASTALAA